MIIKSAKVPPTTQLRWSWHRFTPAYTDSITARGTTVIVTVATSLAHSKTFQTLKKVMMMVMMIRMMVKMKERVVRCLPGAPSDDYTDGLRPLTGSTFSQKSVEVHIVAAEIEF